MKGVIDLPETAESKTLAWYDSYYRERGAARNDLLSNPEVLFQTLAFDKANVRALSRVPLEKESTRILDVGCGSGGSLMSFLRLGFEPANLFGVDINPDRISEGRRRLPNVNFRCENGRHMSFDSGAFDIVFESTMFVQLTDDDLSASIAMEMMRVLKSKGFLMLVDWRYSKPGNPNYVGLSDKRVRRLFRVGQLTTEYAFERGALIPPIGRFVSRYLGALYFPIQLMLPFVSGQVTRVLQKM